MALVEDDASRYLDHLAGMKLPEGIEFGEFKPCFVYHPEMDWLEYLEEDCSTTTFYQKDSSIALLRDNDNPLRIVGIKIVGFSQIAPPEVVEAFKAYEERRAREWKDKIGSDDGR